MLAPIFPIVLEPDSNGRMGWRSSTSHSKSFESAVKNLVNTKQGTFVRQEYYGVKLDNLLELPNNDLPSFLAYRYTKEAFNIFEPRGDIKNVEVTRVESKAYMKLVITDKSDNSEKEYTTEL